MLVCQTNGDSREIPLAEIESVIVNLVDMFTIDTLVVTLSSNCQIVEFTEDIPKFNTIMLWLSHNISPFNHNWRNEALREPFRLTQTILFPAPLPRDRKAN